MSKPAYKPFKSWWIYRDGVPWVSKITRELARKWVKDCGNPANTWAIVRVLVTPHPPRRTSKIKPTLDKGWRG